MKYISRKLTIILVKYLQRKYKSITLKSYHNQSNRVIAKLCLIQAILHYFKTQFHAWGYFHPDCGWSEKDEHFFRKLFPQKNFEELPIVVWRNPSAVTYYQNKIFHLTNKNSPNYEVEIKKQLIEWEKWN